MLFYEMLHKVSVPSSEVFQLHSHNNYEIVYFLQGDIDYIVEGAEYPLSPHDIMLIRPHEMHRALYRSDRLYERIVINVEHEFFEKYQNESYTDVFNRRSDGTQNRICAASVKKSGILDCFSRLRAYSGDYSKCGEPVLAAVLTEILYLLNQIGASDAPTTGRIQQMITYINSHFMDDITLSSLSRRFFISSAHLARIFKAATGYTVSEYAHIKRLTNTVRLYQDGASWGIAADLSGFRDYTSFYRAFRREFGCSPHDYFGMHPLQDASKLTD